MKRLSSTILFAFVLALAGCASTKSGPADYPNVERGDETPVHVEKTETVVTPVPAPISTKNTPESSVLDHNSPDQQIAHP